MFSATRVALVSGFLISMIEQRTFLPYFLVSSSSSFLMSLAAAADNHAGTRALDHDLDFVVLALDLDRRNACVVQTLFQFLTDVVVFHEEVAEHIVPSRTNGNPNS